MRTGTRSALGLALMAGRRATPAGQTEDIMRTTPSSLVDIKLAAAAAQAAGAAAESRAPPPRRI